MSFDLAITNRGTFELQCGDAKIELPMHLLGEILRAATTGGTVASPAPAPQTILKPPVIVRPPKDPRPTVIGVISGRDADTGKMDIGRILRNEIVPASPIRFDYLYELGPTGLAAIEADVRAKLRIDPGDDVILDVAFGPDSIGRRFPIGPVQSIVDSPHNGIGAIRLIADDE